MTATLETIERAALNLPEAQRAFLADRLLSSLEGDGLDELDAAWLAEVERRYAEYKDGKRKPIPASEVLRSDDTTTNDPS